jgi:sRNA-binding protein
MQQERKCDDVSQQGSERESDRKAYQERRRRRRRKKKEERRKKKEEEEEEEEKRKDEANILPSGRASLVTMRIPPARIPATPFPLITAPTYVGGKIDAKPITLPNSIALKVPTVQNRKHIYTHIHRYAHTPVSERQTTHTHTHTHTHTAKRSRERTGAEKYHAHQEQQHDREGLPEMNTPPSTSHMESVVEMLSEVTTGTRLRTIKLTANPVIIRLWKENLGPNLTLNSRVTMARARGDVTEYV